MFQAVHHFKQVAQTNNKAQPEQNSNRSVRCEKHIPSGPYYWCKARPVTRSPRSDLTASFFPSPHVSSRQSDKWKKNDPSFSPAVSHSLSLCGHRAISDPRLSQREEKLITHFITSPSSCLPREPVLFLSRPTQPSGKAWIWMPGEQGVGWEVRVSLGGISKMISRADRHVQELSLTLLCGTLFVRLRL